MKKISIIIILLIGAGSSAVMADPVSFTAGTSGAFGAGSSGGSVGAGGSSLTVGGTTLTFSSHPNELNVILNPSGGVLSSHVTLGVFNASSTALANLTGGTFSLTVTFSLPGDASPNSGIYSGTLSGTVMPGASGAVVQWANTVLTFYSPTAGSFTLTLEPNTPIKAPSSPDASRIRGVLTLTPIPEPATLVLLSAGLAAMAKALGRKKKPEQ